MSIQNVYMNGCLLSQDKSQGSMALQQACYTTHVVLKLHLVILTHNALSSKNTSLTTDWVLTFRLHLGIELLENTPEQQI